MTQPIIIMVAVYMAYLFGLTYLMLSTFAQLYTSPEYYDQSVQDGSLHYAALAIGYVFGTQVTSYLDGWIYDRLQARYNGSEAPELRLPGMVPATLLVPAGMFMYGWCAEGRTHWIWPDIGAFIVSAAIMSAYYCIQRYTVDAYTKYAASALAATVTLRSIAGFCFPLFAPAMYDALRYGWGNSVLAFAAIVRGVPAPFIFWFYGAKMRAKSPFAAG